MKILFTLSAAVLVVAAAFGAVFAQKPKQAPGGASEVVIFAVIDNGATIEPISLVKDHKLITEDERLESPSLAKTFYKTGTKYDLIFGGVSNGTVTIRRSKVGTECGGSSADVSLQSTKAKLSGFVMGLATNASVKSKASGLRRLPTAAERTEIESLVRAEFARDRVPASAAKQLHYSNLTALDVDNDGTPEMIGSYWVAPAPARRGLLFFIAEKDSSGKYQITHSEYSAVTPKDLMSGDLRDLDMMGGELLLDVFDYDHDGVSEIFTIEKAFEGNNYYVYARTDSHWTKVLKAYDYRCAF